MGAAECSLHREDLVITVLVCKPLGWYVLCKVVFPFCYPWLKVKKIGKADVKQGEVQVFFLLLVKLCRLPLFVVASPVPITFVGKEWEWGFWSYLLVEYNNFYS